MIKKYPEFVYVKVTTSAQLFHTKHEFIESFKKYIVLKNHERIDLKCGTTIIFIHELRDGMNCCARIIHADDFLKLCYKHYSEDLKREIRVMADKLIISKITIVIVCICFNILFFYFCA